METIHYFDLALFLKINGAHSSITDFLFFWISNIPIWLPFYALLIYFMIKDFKKKSILVLTFALLSLVASDQSCNYLKRTTERFRPSHEPTLENVIKLVKKPDGTFYYGGNYSFPSAHASNAMICLFITLLFCAPKRKWLIPFIIVWFILICYSRVYLGVHYPTDIFIGSMLGATIGGILLIPLKYFYLRKE